MALSKALNLPVQMLMIEERLPIYLIENQENLHCKTTVKN